MMVNIPFQVHRAHEQADQVNQHDTEYYGVTGDHVAGRFDRALIQEHKHSPPTGSLLNAVLLLYPPTDPGGCGAREGQQRQRRRRIN